MSETIDQMIGDIIAHESAKYTDTPGDAGGPTKYGISLRFLRGVPLPIADRDHDGDIDAADVRLIDHDEAAQIFKSYFYMRPQIYTLEANFQPMMFDEAVNFGPAHAIECLQEAILVPADGRIGDMTRTSLTAAVHRLGERAVKNLICDKFVARYRSIAEGNPANQKFLQGWENRANSWRTK